MIISFVRSDTEDLHRLRLELNKVWLQQCQTLAKIVKRHGGANGYVMANVDGGVNGHVMTNDHRFIFLFMGYWVVPYL